MDNENENNEAKMLVGVNVVCPKSKVVVCSVCGSPDGGGPSHLCVMCDSILVNNVNDKNDAEGSCGSRMLPQDHI